MNEIKDALPIPEHCDNCCSINVEYADNSVIYGKNYGDWPKCYFCRDCRAAVGCHPQTNIPLGRMADKETRTLRSKAHYEFDRLWKDRLMTRSKAYNWLSIQLGIDESQCHISWLSKDQLKDVATLSAQHFQNNYEALIKRKAKNDAKQRQQRNNRNATDDSAHIKRRKRR